MIKLYFHHLDITVCLKATLYYDDIYVHNGTEPIIFGFPKYYKCIKMTNGKVVLGSQIHATLKSCQIQYGL